MEFNNITTELGKYNFVMTQNNIDTNICTNVNTNVNKQMELVTITGIDIDQTQQNADIYKALVNESNNDVSKRNGLTNKFILYKPTKVKSFNANNTDITNYNLNHTGLYFCDESQNLYRLSTDFRFNETIKNAVDAIVSEMQSIKSSINELDDRISYLETTSYMSY